MQVTQTNADGLKREFKITVPAEQIEQQVQDRLLEVSRTIRLSGFRPGKAPLGLLRKKYGASIRGEVIETVVNDGTRQAIDENKLRPALRPRVEFDSAEEGADLVFTVALETLPDIKVTELGAIALEKPVAEVTDDEVEEAVNHIAEHQQRTEPTEADHAAEKGEVTVIDFLGKLDGTPFDGGKGEGFALTLGSNSFIPGFEDQLVGVKAGEQRDVAVRFPDEYHAKDLAGKDAVFEVSVKEVRRVLPTSVDEDLAKAVGMESLDALRKALRERLAQDRATLSRLHLKRRLLDVLAESHDFPVPPGMVDLEFQGIWHQIEHDRADGHLDEEDAAKGEDELKAEYSAIAERRVRLGLVLSEIGRSNNIQVTDEDLNRAVVNEARQFPGQEALVFQYYQKTEGALDRLRPAIFEDKVVDFILELAKVTEKPVSLEELRKDPNAAESEEPAPAKTRAKAKKAEEASSEAPAEGADTDEAEATTKRPAKTAKKKAKDSE